MRDDREYVHNVLETIETINREILQPGDFFREESAQHAAVFLLRSFGTTTTRLSGELKQRHPELPWKIFGEFSSRTYSPYSEIDRNAVWFTAQQLSSFTPRLNALFNDPEIYQRTTGQVSPEGGPRRRITMAELQERRDEIYALASRHGITNISVFGSVARGQADEDSDLDLLVEVAPETGYFELMDFASAVQQMLGVFTQISTSHGLKDRIRNRVLAEARQL